MIEKKNRTRSKNPGLGTKCEKYLSTLYFKNFSK
jgi:hypothetical protein